MFQREISKLKNCDLPRYIDYLFDLILEKKESEKFRKAVLNRIEEVRGEIKKREVYICDAGNCTNPAMTNNFVCAEHSGGCHELA